MFHIFNRPKCDACSKTIKKDENLHQLQVETGEGLLTMEICTDCADIFNKLAELPLEKKK